MDFVIFTFHTPWSRKINIAIVITMIYHLVKCYSLVDYLLLRNQKSALYIVLTVLIVDARSCWTNSSPFSFLVPQLRASRLQKFSVVHAFRLLFRFFFFFSFGFYAFNDVLETVVRLDF